MRLPRLPQLGSRVANRAGASSGAPASGEAASPLSSQLEANLTNLKQQLCQSDDVVVRRLTLSSYWPAALVLIENLANLKLVEQSILTSITFQFPEEEVDRSAAPERFLGQLRDRVLASANARETRTSDDLILGLLGGDTALLIEGSAVGLLLFTPSAKRRDVEEPAAEAVIRGPREGFVEDAHTNVALLRHIVRNPKLVVKRSSIGRRSRTEVVVVYLEDLVNQEALAELQGRMATVDVDGIVLSGALEQLIEDRWVSPFPQVESTERPDRVALALLQGRIGVIVDGTPFALIVPTTFNSLMLSPEDYAFRWHMGTFVRLVRFLAVPATLLLPALYVALVSFHPELLPTRLMISIGVTELEVPYPTVIEVLLLEVAIELIREAAVRMPQQLRQAIGVVAGLIVGEAAVRAGLVSNVTVVVTAATAVGSYAIPNYALAFTLRMLRFGLILAAGTFGLFGLMMGFLVILIHLAGLESFGVYYLSPIAPARYQSWRDTVVRFPTPALERRPVEFSPQDAVRLKDRRPEKEV